MIFMKSYKNIKDKNLFWLAIFDVILFIILMIALFAFNQPKYVLYGDYKHDDTNSFQAWLEDKQVYYSNGERVGQKIKHKAFIITNTLYFRGGSRKEVTNSFFEFRNMTYKKKYTGYFNGIWYSNQECEQSVQCRYEYDKWRLNNY